MANAFLNFNEPHAWVIRGLVEYGWRDLTGRGSAVPHGAPGGLDLSPLLSSHGRDGVRLVVLPVADGRRVEETNYEFEVKVTGDLPNIRVVARCPDCNYLEEFAFEMQNPTYAAGYLHQSVVKHVAEFARWRLGGEELTWAQRMGVPEITGDPCSAELVRWVSSRLRQPGFSFDLGPSEGWWLNLQPGLVGSGPPIASTGKGGGDPVYISAAGRAELAAMGGAKASVERVAALDYVSGPAGWLRFVKWGGTTLGGLAFLNALITVYFYGTSRGFALVTSVIYAGLMVGGAILAGRGLERYREVRPHWTVFFLFAYAALAAPCCLVGLPLSIWAILVWLKPEVKAGRILA